MTKDNQVKLTRGTKELIKQAITHIETSDDKNNRYKICDQVCQLAVDRYQGNNLMYQLERMDMPTTQKVLEKIDAYFYIYNRPY